MIEFNKVPKIEEIKLDNIKAIIFDMDGTLLDSEILHAKALHDVLDESQGNKSIDVEALLRDFIGVAEPDVFQSLVDKEIIPPMSLEDFINMKNDRFKTILKDKAISKRLLHSDLLSLIKKFREKNYKVALVTASERETTNIFMNELGISSNFDVILTRNDTTKSKPNPMPYLRSFELLNIEASEALIFEDSPTGLKAAIEAGGNVCKVTWY